LIHKADLKDEDRFYSRESLVGSREFFTQSNKGFYAEKKLISWGLLFGDEIIFAVSLSVRAQRKILRIFGAAVVGSPDQQLV